MRDDLVLMSGSASLHHHYHHNHPRQQQQHPAAPSSRRSYDSPSSSSPASSNNDPPPAPPLPLPSISNPTACFAPLPPPLPPQFGSPGTQRHQGAAPHAPTPPAKPEALSGLADEPCSSSFLGKIKAFEKMHHLTQTHRLLEVQEAENAKVGVAKKKRLKNVTFVGYFFYIYSV